MVEKALCRGDTLKGRQTDSPLVLAENQMLLSSLPESQRERTELSQLLTTASLGIGLYSAMASTLISPPSLPISTVNRGTSGKFRMTSASQRAGGDCPFK